MKGPQVNMIHNLLSQIINLPNLKNQYWLVKIELADLLSYLPPISTPNIQQNILDILLDLLRDEDNRVRRASADTLISIIPNLIFEIDGDPLMCHTIGNNHQITFRIMDKLLSNLIVNETGSVSKVSGYIEALLLLSVKYPPKLDPCAWGLLPSSTDEMSPILSMLQTLVQFLTCDSSICLELTTHSNTLKLCSNLIQGLSLDILSKLKKPVVKFEGGFMSPNKSFDTVSFELLTHVVKVLNIISHNIDETPVSIPSSNSITSSSSGLNRSSLLPQPQSPLISGGKENSDHWEHLGSFKTSPYYIKVYEILRNVYSTFKTTLVGEDSKLLTLLESNLIVLQTLLEYSIGNLPGGSGGKSFTEEILGYLKSTSGLNTKLSLECVESLLGCIFRMNTASNFLINDQDSINYYPTTIVVDNDSFYDRCFKLPVEKLVKLYGLHGSTTITTTGIQDVKVGASPKPKLSVDRSSLASFIRLFEPMVIKALKHYTLTSNIQEQGTVLRLLVQLVRLRVNYCLLDSDQIFVGYVIKQLEHIEEGSIAKAHLLIPEIFKFLVLLSYEKYHSKVIIDIPKILQLTKGLLASTSTFNYRNIVVPALLPIATDLFIHRAVLNNSKVSLTNPADLETQREVVLSILIKLMHFPEILQLLVSILNNMKNSTSTDGGLDDKYRKVSRILMDALLPLLENQKVVIDELTDLDIVRQFFQALAPGVLRPVDQLLSAVLTCSVDLSSSTDIGRWLGFISIILPVITSQSPEEGILSRLEELGIIIGSASPVEGVLATSIDSSISSTGSSSIGGVGGNGGIKPEMTLGRFIFQVIGASTSKIHQIIYSSHNFVDTDPHYNYLKDVLTSILNFVVYMFSSGRFIRVSEAASDISSKNIDDMLYTMDFIDEIMLQLSHWEPHLTLQWYHICTRIGRVSQNSWSRVLKTFNTSCNNYEILQRGGLILFCDYLANHNNKNDIVDLITWFIMNYTSEIISNVREPPVLEFVNNRIHTGAPSSGLFLQAVMTRCSHLINGVIFQRNALIALEKVHNSHSGKILSYLITTCLISRHLSLSFRVNKMACQRIETLLASNSTLVMKEQLNTDTLSNILDLIRHHKLIKRYGRLVSLLNKLSILYDLSPIEPDESRTFNPGSISATIFNKDWFLETLRTKCSINNVNNIGASECALMLMTDSLQYDDVLPIMSAKEFNIKILESVFINSNNDVSNPIIKAASFVLTQRLKSDVIDVLPNFEIYHPQDRDPTNSENRYSDRMDIQFSQKEFRDNLTDILSTISTLQKFNAAFTEKLLSEKCGDPVKHNLSRLGILALEFVFWIDRIYNSDDVKGIESCKSLSLKTVAVLWRIPNLMEYLGTEIQFTIASVHLIYAIISGLDESLKYPTCQHYQSLINEHQHVHEPLINANLKMNQLFTNYFIVNNKKSKYNSSSYEHIILGLSRLPIFMSYLRIPTEIWDLGWTEGIPSGPHNTEFPLISVDLLQEVDILKDYVVRLAYLGWNSRQQFEESWVSLLGVFNVTKDDLSEDEIQALSQCSAIVVQSMTSLLLQTLDLPYPGNSNSSKPLHHPRDVPAPFLMTSRGHQLTSIQNKIHKQLGDNVQFLQVNSSVNLERCGDDPPSNYSVAQVSVHYLLSAIRYYGNHNDDLELEGSSCLPLPLILRDEGLTLRSLDLTSCLKTLFDLYGQWFINGADTPLILLKETVKSILMLSDIFTEENHFEWMLNHFNELMRVHPTEDEIIHGLLRLGICKALAVIGPGTGKNNTETFDRIRKSIELGLKSHYVPARISSMHGILYLLQSINNGGGDDDDLNLIPLGVDYLQTYLQSQDYGESHSLITWSLTFYLLENYESSITDKTWVTTVLQLAISTAGQASTPRGLYLLLLSGFERLIVSFKTQGLLRNNKTGSNLRFIDQINKLCTDLLTESNPSLVLPSIQLFIVCMYSDVIGDEEEERIQDHPERLMRAMEQMSILFDCVRRSGPNEAKLLCKILPQVIVDFFPAADVINRVINEFISPGQPHQTLLAGVMFQVFGQAAAQDQTCMLTEWVLMALPNFTKRSPISHSVWCLSCFFLSAATSNPWLQNLFPLLQKRIGYYQHEDKKLFVLAARDFYNNLIDSKQKDNFISTFQAVSVPKTPYYDLIQSLTS